MKLRMLIIALCLLNLIICNSYTSSFQSHLEMMHKMRLKSKTFLENLFNRANDVIENEKSQIQFIEKTKNERYLSILKEELINLKEQLNISAKFHQKEYNTEISLNLNTGNIEILQEHYNS